MVLRCRLSTLMGQKKMNIQAVCNATGLARNTVRGLYFETSQRVDYNTILELCTLFNCEIGELFVIDEAALQTTIKEDAHAEEEIDENMPF
jgi:putative transcriptional regulator